MSKTELEHHLLQAWKSWIREYAPYKRSRTRQSRTSIVSDHTAEMQQFNEFYKSLEPLL